MSTHRTGLGILTPPRGRDEQSLFSAAAHVLQHLPDDAEDFSDPVPSSVVVAEGRGCQTKQTHPQSQPSPGMCVCMCVGGDSLTVVSERGDVVQNKDYPGQHLPPSP